MTNETITGKFITIEGIEGAGKSSVLSFIQQYLTNCQIPVVTTREPGGTPLAEAIRELLLQRDHKEHLHHETELLLMYAGRGQHIKECIQPALSKGQWVVSDRFVDASYAYQGGGREIPEKHIHYLDEWLVGRCHPDLTILLDVDPDVGRKRTQKRGGQPDRIEVERQTFFERVREVYLNRAARDAQRIKVIDANQSEAAVREQVQRVLDIFLGIAK